MAHLISIVGPTGAGKSAMALQVAQRLGCPIVSADSVQIYRGLDIGSGKVTAEERGNVPHFMLDVVDPDERFNAGEFARQCEALLQELFLSYPVVVMAGGTGLYFQAVWDGLDEMPEVSEEIRAALNAALIADGLPALQAELAAADPETWAVIDRNNPARIIRALEVYRATGLPISMYRKGGKREPNPWLDIKIGLEWPREVLYARIETRIDQMIADGLLDETEAIAGKYGWDCPALGSLGYREMVGYHNGEFDWLEALRLLKRNTRRYAKRQLTWFRKYEDLPWFQADATVAVLDHIDAQLRRLN